MAAMINMFNTIDLILMLQAAVPLGKDQRKKEGDHHNHLQITKSSKKQYVLQIIRIFGHFNRIGCFCDNTLSCWEDLLHLQPRFDSQLTSVVLVVSIIDLGYKGAQKCLIHNSSRL